MATSSAQDAGNAGGGSAPTSDTAHATPASASTAHSRAAVVALPVCARLSHSTSADGAADDVGKDADEEQEQMAEGAKQFAHTSGDATQPATVTGPSAGLEDIAAIGRSEAACPARREREFAIARTLCVCPHESAPPRIVA